MPVCSLDAPESKDVSLLTGTTGKRLSGWVTHQEAVVAWPQLFSASSPAVAELWPQLWLSDQVAAAVAAVAAADWGYCLVESWMPGLLWLCASWVCCLGG